MYCLAEDAQSNLALGSSMCLSVDVIANELTPADGRATFNLRTKIPARKLTVVFGGRIRVNTAVPSDDGASGHMCALAGDGDARVDVRRLQPVRSAVVAHTHLRIVTDFDLLVQAHSDRSARLP